MTGYPAEDYVGAFIRSLLKGFQARLFRRRILLDDSSDRKITIQKYLERLSFQPERLPFMLFIKDKVEETLPSIRPDCLSLLRLDTDWYESTKHELIHLFPFLVPRGLLIIDDRGYWQGARKAVDEYLTERNLNLYLHRVDYSCRVGVRTGSISAERTTRSPNGVSLGGNRGECGFYAKIEELSQRGTD